MKHMSTITHNLSIMMTDSLSFNNYTPYRQHRKRTNQSEAWTDKAHHQKDIITETNQDTWPRSNEKLITNTVSEGTIDSNTEINSLDDTASIHTSNRFNLYHNINKSDSCTRSQKHESIAENNATSKVLNEKDSNINSSRKTKAYTKK
ncbi:hypothetical protein O181_102553 [Austropuccinia psidii MF-1]|uniref:Uncharacterized protein n=1 Tax=Austropuccinia psidii MF-1 TaxID=1389203 RepID=A0A9Q3JGJ8_9BASI|nr:hypothetical protein [Austropuccinia psidii MF-1]